MSQQSAVSPQATASALPAAAPRKNGLRRLMTSALVTMAVAPALMFTGAQSASASVGSNIVAIAEANLGKGACDTNSAGGSGYYTSCGESWCADFAKWVWAQNGVNVAGLTPAAGSFGKYGSGLHSTPHVGDAAVFNYNGAGYADHVSLVTSVNSDGSVGTIGGNQSGKVTRGKITAAGYYGSQKISGYASPIGGRGGDVGGDLGRVRWADWDGDGKSDYITVEDSGAVKVYVNKGGDGHGGWQELGQVATGLTNDRNKVRFADFDGDRKADYIVISDSGALTVYLNKGGDGRGGWENIGQVATGTTRNADQVRFADFDGDGKADYLTVADSGAVEAYLNRGGDGHGGWDAQGQIASGLTSDRSRVRFADFDGDGKADYVVINGNGSVVPYFNRGGDGHGGWDSPGQVATGLTTDQDQVAFADFAGDRRADYLFTKSGGGVEASVNNGGDGHGGWQSLGQIAAGA
ncbi:FG-GAP-like repeat-containing protein [Streptomyces sp. NPDC089919]|uniref:FG-GAP-like repeat-containing protein n=1 Tax=Streptomyces sp. NPDC089919 TaxID=3155188 RepID=UPI0034180538